VVNGWLDCFGSVSNLVLSMLRLCLSLGLITGEERGPLRGFKFEKMIE